MVNEGRRDASFERDDLPSPPPQPSQPASPTTPALGPLYDQPRVLHPNIQVAWTMGAAITAVFLTGLSAAVELSAGGWGIATVIVFLLLLARAIWWPRVRYRRWSYAIRPHDVLVNYGVLWRRRVCIPRLRVQHVDVESGPLERRLGLCHVDLHTAGSSAAAARIEGITPEQAEELRRDLVGDAVRAVADGSAAEGVDAGAESGTAHVERRDD